MPRRRVVNHNLNRRGSVWWLKKRVPQDVILDFGKRWVEESLRTSDLPEARRRRDRRVQELESIWDALRRHGDVGSLAGLAKAHEWERKFAPEDAPRVSDDLLDQFDIAATRWGRSKGLIVTQSPDELDRVRRRFAEETDEGRTLDRRLSASVGDPSFVVAGETWLSNSNLSVRTQREYRRYIELADAEFPSVDRVDPVRAREWVQAFARRYSMKSVINLRNALCGLWGHLGKDPSVWRGFRVEAGVSAVLRQVWTIDEIRQLFEAAANLSSVVNSRRLRLAMMIALYTGARAREVAGLEYQDEDGLILIPEEVTKGSAPARLLPCIRPMRPLLQEWQERRWAGNTLTNRFSAFKKEQGFVSRDKVFHSFRHTLMTQLHADGVQEATAALIAGHRHKGITYGVYGGKLEATALLPHIERLPWFDLFGEYL